MAQPSAPLLQDKSEPFSHRDQPVNTLPYAHCYPEPPPPYSPYDASASMGPTPTPALAPVAVSQPSAPYPKQAPVAMMPVAPVQAPMQQMVAPAAHNPAQIIVLESLPPGTCTVCRKGKLENSASIWTWLCCCLLLPIGILPGLFAFCCCCRGPKCTHCGYTP